MLYLAIDQHHKQLTVNIRRTAKSRIVAITLRRDERGWPWFLNLGNAVPRGLLPKTGGSERLCRRTILQPLAYLLAVLRGTFP